MPQRDARDHSERDLYRHMRDQDVPEPALETSIGEGWTIRALCDHNLAEGLIEPID